MKQTKKSEEELFTTNHVFGKEKKKHFQPTGVPYPDKSKKADKEFKKRQAEATHEQTISH